MRPDVLTIPEGRRLIVISAPSGAGKTTLCRYVIERFPSFRLSISHTTRKPRGDETNGREYHFVSEEQFLSLLAHDGFVEHARVYDRYYYGTSWDSITGILDAGFDAALDIDVQGAGQIRRRFPAAELVLILPPSYDELARRLRERKTDDPEEIRRRLAQAKTEIAQHRLFDYLVVNDRLDSAQAALDAIVRRTPAAVEVSAAVMLPRIAPLLSP